MIWLFLCITFNILLAIIFKTFQRYNVDNHNAIVINYFVCVIVASIVLGEFAFPMNLWEKPWAIWAVLLGLLFISGFNVMALSFQKSGVAITAIVQKMSLIVPSSFAIAFYSEPLPWMKGLGIGIALAAIFFVNHPNDETSKRRFSLWDPILILPLLTLVMSGIIEILLFYVEVEGLVVDEGILFTSTCFGLAGIFGAIYSLYRVFAQGIYPRMKELKAGITLGVPNFLTIYLLVFLLSKGWQASVLFPINSVGILIGTSIVGFLLYKEHGDRYKIIGIGLGVLAILLISSS